MTTLADLIASQTRTPSATVYIDGRRWVSWRSITKAQAFGRGPASYTIEGADPPVTPRGGMSIRWTWGYNGIEVPGGTGYIVVPQQASYPRGWSLQCQDVLWLAQRVQSPIAGGAPPYNNITARAAIEYILETYAGITRHQIPDIKRPSDSGTDWTLGQLTPVYWERTTALQAIQEIAGAAGAWVFADDGGTVRLVPIERRPSDRPFRTLMRGDASDGGSLLVEGAPRRTQDWASVKNRTTVYGANTGVEGAQLRDVFLATHVLSPGLEVDNEYRSTLLEYEADVTAVASRITGYTNREPNVIDGRIKADPRLRLGMTIGIQDSGVSYAATRTFFLFGLTTTFDRRTAKFDQSVTLDGGTGSAGYSLLPEPLAQIAYTLKRETLDGDAVVEVTCDGSGSTAYEGEIVSYAWSTSDTVYSGTASSGSGSTFTFVILESEAPFSITLTVTDTNSKTDTETVEIALDGDAVAPVIEQVHAAGGAAWSYTADGGAAWNDDVRTCTIVAEGAGVWDTAPLTDGQTYGALATSSAQVRQTLDGLATASALLSTAGGSITALHVNARNGARVWRAVGTTVQRSTDGGTTWSTMGTAPASVRQILEDPALNNRLFALAGANFITSADGGANWSTFYAGPSGATARWFVRSESGTITWVCYTGTFTGSPLQRIEGSLAATFTAASPAVAEVRAIALTDGYEPGAPRLVAFDADGRTWVGDAETGVLTEGPALPADAVAQHAAASRRAPIVYLADFDSVSVGVTGALRKLLIADGNQALLPWRLGPSGRQYHMVQLAAEARTAVYSLLVGTKGLTPGGIYVRSTSGAWTLTNSGLPSAWDWEAIVASPFSTAEWLVIGRPTGSTADTVTTSSAPYEVEIDGTGYSPFWLTTDGGATYTEYRVTSGARGYANAFIANDDRRATYTSQGEIAVKVELAETVGGNIYLDIWRGGTQVVHEDVGTRPNGFNGSGTGGDLLVTYSDSAGTTFYRGYIPGTGTGLTGFTTSAFRTSLFRDAGGSSAAFSLVSTSVLRYDDYRASGSGTTIASGLTGLANFRALADAAYLIATAGVVQIADPTGTPSVSTVRSGTYNPNMGRSDQGAQQFLLVRTGTTLEVWDGSGWAQIPAPTGLVDADMSALGIIDEGALT